MSQSAIAVHDIVERTGKARSITDDKVRDIQQVNSNLRMLAFNALIEAQRVGELGAGFGVVADEVKSISAHVDNLARNLTNELGGEIESLEKMACEMAEQANGARMIDLALNAVELIDRNLYERTCDVRWWATDSAVVDALAEPTEHASRYASDRLGVILDAYTVYLDLWLCDMQGNIIANGRPGRYPIVGANVSTRPWFRQAKALASGEEYAVDNVGDEILLENSQVATYAASVRRGGQAHGEALGVLGIHFDWRPQAEAIVQGARLSDEERQRTEVMLTDANGLVIASSSSAVSMNERIALSTKGQSSGYYQDSDGRTIAFHCTPGYETYEGLGWHGVIRQSQY